VSDWEEVSATGSVIVASIAVLALSIVGSETVVGAVSTGGAIASVDGAVTERADWIGSGSGAVSSAISATGGFSEREVFPPFTAREIQE
jgi:hypothetical protein